MWLDKLYHKFLWFTGFRKGEHISDMLPARSRGLAGCGGSFPSSPLPASLALPAGSSGILQLTGRKI